MATGKRYYWIKLKESFMNSDTVDYLMSQPNGANYVVLYELLCLKTINTGGRLARKIGEIIIPFDVEKIQRDCKWFPADTIRIALNLYRSFGLIYEDVDGTLVLADHGNLIGSETDYAAQKKAQRKSQLPAHSVDIVHTGVQEGVYESVHTDIRDKEIRDKEFRDKREDLNNTPPTRACACARESAGEDSLSNPELGRVMDFYLDKINATPSTALTSELAAYTADLSADVVLHALGVALDERKTSWSYIRAILQRYCQEGLRTLAAVQDSELQHQTRDPSMSRYATRYGQRSPPSGYSDDKKVEIMRRMLDRSSGEEKKP